jgi:hypothetical protein
MPRRGHLMLFLHGSILLVLSMILGLPPFSLFSESMSPEKHLFWRQAHVILIATGVWMVAVGSAMPHLALTDRRERLLTWSMIISGYSFALSLPIQGTAIYHGCSSKDLVHCSGYNLYVAVLSINGGLALLAAFIVIIGAFSLLEGINK